LELASTCKLVLVYYLPGYLSQEKHNTPWSLNQVATCF